MRKTRKAPSARTRVSPPRTAKPPLTVAHIVAEMERVAPTALAQDWDNVGLIAGDLHARVDRLLLTIDLTGDVVREAGRGSYDMVIAYHPPIFKPVACLRTPSTDMGALVFDCIRSGIAIYSPHTALDAADGGTNDVLAGLCGVKRSEPLEYIDDAGPPKCKIVVFVPAEHVEKLSGALWAAGAGRIGDYTHCSFRLSGEGTFHGAEKTNPSIGVSGRLERVPEVRLECVIDARNVPGAIDALRRNHPYEEPAFDIYPLKPALVRGIGRIGTLPRASTVRDLARKLKRATGAAKPELVGDPARVVDRVVVLAGSAGTLPFRIDLTPRDVIITGEIRHHDALTVLRRGCSAIALGHWASERPVLAPLAARLQSACLGATCKVSAADRAPFTIL